jgi:hypothetical protein
LKTASRRLINDYQGFTRSLAEPSLSADLPVKFIDPIAATEGYWRMAKSSVSRNKRTADDLVRIGCQRWLHSAERLTAILSKTGQVLRVVSKR